MQIDGGKTFVEPTAIMCGQVEGMENVTLRVHDACFTSGGRRFCPRWLWA
jgi:hypothetical protein